MGRRPDARSELRVLGNRARAAAASCYDVVAAGLDWRGVEPTSSFRNFAEGVLVNDIKSFVLGPMVLDQNPEGRLGVWTVTLQVRRSTEYTTLRLTGPERQTTCITPYLQRSVMGVTVHDLNSAEYVSETPPVAPAEATDAADVAQQLRPPIFKGVVLGEIVEWEGPSDSARTIVLPDTAALNREALHHTAAEQQACLDWMGVALGVNGGQPGSG